MAFKKGQIVGVSFRQLIANTSHDGWLAEIFRTDEGLLSSAEQVNISFVLPGKIKAFHAHEKQADLVTVLGACRIVLIDAREDSPTKGNVIDLFSYPERWFQVQIPPGILHGFQAIGPDPIYLVYCTDKLFKGLAKKRPADEERYPADLNGQFSWEVAPD